MLRRGFLLVLVLVLALAAAMLLSDFAKAQPVATCSGANVPVASELNSPQGLVANTCVPSWVLPPAANGVDLYFANGLYWLADATGALTNSRLTNETCFTSGGNLVQVGPNQNCVTDLGVEAQEGRTNTIYNSSFAGGSSGVWPPHCSYYWPVGKGAATITPSAPYMLNGMPVIDIVFAGTPSSAGTISFGCAVNTDAPAAAGQTWAITEYLMLKSGSLAGTSGWATLVSQWNAALSQVNVVAGNSVNASVGPSGVMTNYGTVKTLVNVAAGVPTVYMTSYFQFNVTTSPLNFTLTMGYHGQELNPNIPASVASATVATGGTCTPGSNITWTIPTVNGGTAATVTGTVTGTTLSGTLTVTGAGSYTVDATHGLPASPVTVTGGTCTTQPTINLVPVDNSAQAFATTPILTTNGALARSPDSITLPVAACSGSGSLYAIGIPAAPAGYLQYQSIAQIDDGTSNNRLDFSRAPGGYVVANSTVGGVGVNVTASAAPVAAGVSGKTSLFATASTLKTVYNNGTINSGAVTGFPAGMTTLRIGIANGGQAPFNGTISRVAVACGQSLLLSEAPANNNDMFAANDNVPWLKAVGVF